MSRIGKKPVLIPSGVQINVEGDGRKVTVAGPKGQLSQQLTGSIRAEVDPQSKALVVRRDGDLRADRALHGLYRALLNNMVVGVTKGYEKRLEVQGIGYRVVAQGNRVQLFVGYNTKIPEVFAVPDGVKVTCPTPTEILVQGANKQLVGQVAAELRHIKPPDVYKGKGIRYQGEVVRKLPGKTVGATATAK